MNKSYRSTIEITELAQRINRNSHLEPIERHGDRPDIISCSDAEQEVNKIRQAVTTFLTSHHNSLGIIRKTRRVGLVVAFACDFVLNSPSQE